MTTRFLRMLAAALALCAPLAQAGDTPGTLPIQLFFDNPDFTGAELSPTASYLAVRIGGDKVRERLAVIDLKNMSAKIVGGFDDADVDRFEWISDERLVFNTRDRTSGQGDVRYAPGLFAVNRDGASFRRLAEVEANFITSHTLQKTQPWHTFLPAQMGLRNSSSIYVLSPEYEQLSYAPRFVNLVKLDTVTGHAVTVHRPAEVQEWLLDQDGEPRLAVSHDHDKTIWWYRDPAKDNAWSQMTSFGTFKGRGGIHPLGFAPDGTFYVISNHDLDKQALFRYDLGTRQLDKEPLVALKDFDFNGGLIVSQGKLMGVRYLADARATAWFDPAMKTAQAEIDALLPATVNLVQLAARPESPWLLVVSYSDRQPNVYRLYNQQTHKLMNVGATRPAVDPKQMATEDFVHFKARDGLDIPAWLTLPKGDHMNRPMVVLVHGGPFVRGGEWGWHPDAQFLASRGYVVLEPEFRGSTGYGAHHYHAGWKQWGLKMQDDLADGTRWAIAQGYADPKRICIAGASYGGYATLMGLVNDPDLYKCGIDWVGVTDINLLYTGHWSKLDDLSEDYRRYGMPVMVGDRRADAAQLKATSPLEQASRIRQPLLLAYGGSDVRVPIYHGRKFLDAVRQVNQNVEWVEYPEEGHGWALPKNRIDFWSRVEHFLDRNIGH